MSYTATIKFAPILTVERLNDPKWSRPGRTMYDPGSLRFLPSKTSVPLLIDHQEDKVIGRVHKLWQLPWVDGPWICAEATVDVEPHLWLKRGARASFGYKVLRERKATYPDTSPDVIAHALVDEVSILSPGRKPAEPLAEVLSLKATPAAARSSASGLAAGEVIHGSPGQVLVRPALGHVLGVR